MKLNTNNLRNDNIHTLLFCLSIAAAFFFTSCGNKKNAQQNTLPPPAYQVFKVAAQTTTIKTDYPATLQGEQNIEIRPKIDGYIEKIYVDEGAVVKKGQLLFRISAPQYQQDVNNATAAINSAEADVSAAELQLKKVKPLVEKGIVSKFEQESAEYTLKTRQAALAQAKANFATAKINLGYTDVTSPVNGVVGSIPYRLGSLVGSNTTMPLTMVSSIGNVFAYFSMNEKQLLDFSREYAGKTLQAKLKQLPPVTLLLADGSTYPEKGNVETIAGLLNTETGSASFRASFPNPVGLLRSGASATVQIPVLVNDAIIIPQRSARELQGQYFVYLVNENNKVISAEIEVMGIAAGQYYIVTKGLNAGDIVVYESTSSLQDSTVIRPDMLPANKVYNNLD